MIRHTLILLCISMAANLTEAAKIRSTFYGKINVSNDYFNPGDNDWINNASRLGVKGKYRLDEDFEIVYQMEQEVDVVHGGTRVDTLFSIRNTFIGVKGSFGRFIFGAHDTPTKNAQGKVDVFNNNQSDIKQLFVGEVRARDSFLYTSPKLKNIFKIGVMYVPGDSHFDASQSYAMTYNNNGLMVSFGYDRKMRKNEKAVAKTKVYDTFRTAMQYKLGKWKLGGLYQLSEQQNKIGADKETGYVISATYQHDALTFKAQFGHTDITASDRHSVSLGVDYKLTKNVRCYVYYMEQEDYKSDQEVIEIGAEIKF